MGQLGKATHIMSSWCMDGMRGARACSTSLYTQDSAITERRFANCCWAWVAVVLRKMSDY